MKKLLLVAMAAMLVAGSAFAERNLVAQPNATYVFGAPGTFGFGPTTTNNDDSCDIGVAPAATLLLPYFEVELNEPTTTARTTLFTVTNVSHLPQIAHVTLWTEWSYPALDFNIYLTGYDVQSINLYDVLGGGVPARTGFIGSSTPTTNLTVAPNNFAGNTGETYADPARGTGGVTTDQNPNFDFGLVAARCPFIPGNIPQSVLNIAVGYLTTGVAPSGTGITGLCTATANPVGGNHPGIARGYVTIDVANNCSFSLPNDPTYFSSEILFDNVLIGEYYDVNPDPSTVGAAAGNYAGGNPMVHIRAIPEGGPAGSVPGTNLPYTFYDRYIDPTAATGTAGVGIDRRQPLPAIFAARYISGSGALFDTRYKIWREGLTAGTAGCAAYVNNANMPVERVVRFDEQENASTQALAVDIISPQPITAPGGLPEASQTAVANTSAFPAISTASTSPFNTGGWMYLNLNNAGATGLRTGDPYRLTPAGAALPYNVGGIAATGTRPSQNWVIVSMFAEGRYGVDYDAAWLGNGCSSVPASTARIGPAGGVLVCPPGALCTSDGQTIYTNTVTGATGPGGTNVTPDPIP